MGSPVDVVKSRIMGDKVVRRFACRTLPHGDANRRGVLMRAACPRRCAQKQYNGMLDCFGQTYRKEGLTAFYKGFMPNFARLGSWNVVMFLSLEKVKKAYLDSVADKH